MGRYFLAGHFDAPFFDNDSFLIQNAVVPPTIPKIDPDSQSFRKCSIYSISRPADSLVFILGSSQMVLATATAMPSHPICPIFLGHPKARASLQSERVRFNHHLDQEYGNEMIAPNRENRSQTKDGRAPRRYLRRWVVERLFAWLHRFRRLVVRYEFHAENFLGLVRLGCMKIMLCYL
jgi:hypothetical protein